MEPREARTTVYSFEFRCPLAAGLHARPASKLSEVAGAFDSECTLANQRNAVRANLKSVLSIIAAEVGHHDLCTVSVAGSDAAVASVALQRFIESDLPLADEPLLQETQSAGTLPRSLRDAGVAAIFGTPASQGIGRGRVVLLGGVRLPPEMEKETAGAASAEQARVDAAVNSAKGAMEARLAVGANATERGVLQAHLALLADPSLLAKIAELIRQGRSAGQAVAAACQEFVAMLHRSDSRYIRERALDMQDVCSLLLREMYGDAAAAGELKLTGLSVVAGENCTPQQLLSLHRERLRGLVLEAGGATSHTLILARSLGIAALSGARGAASLKPGADIVVDGSRGFAVEAGAPAVERFYARELAADSRRRERLARFALAPAVTTDGRRLEIGANVAAVAELVPAFQNGADGIGVFRTEMLFVGRDQPPSEAEQSEAYIAAVRAAAGKPVLIRTLDVGGDKPLACLRVPQEANPFLGLRGVRLYAGYQALILEQLRAILRASAHGPVMLMVPMIASLDEVRWCKALLERARTELASEEVTIGDNLQFGIMLEVPSVAFAMDDIARAVDFFSIGTNDLAQYFFAADRDQPALAKLASPRAPAFLRFLKHAVDAAHKAGKWIGVCGQMAADAANLPLMIGLGVDEIGVPASEIPRLKENVARLSAHGCEELLVQALAAMHTTDVDALLAGAAAAPQPLLAEDLVITGSDARDKDEAIQDLLNALWIAGRVEDRIAVEEAIWAREQVYSTGLGHGFAIPHCKIAAARTASVAIAKFQQPIEWGSLDQKPVQLAILLALPENAAREHMQLFSRLARKLMDEQFRADLLGAATASEIVSVFRQNVGVEN